ncbi:MAG: LysE family translocator [Pseudomonadota bacterium]|nr:LysE family translocator [Pseudomonadota bacterium]
MIDLTSLGSGLVFGLTAGISPGPLLALVISETIRDGFKAGLQVAMAPLISDLPIILISILILSKLSRSTPVLGIITLAGAIFIAYLAYECFHTATLNQQPEESNTGSLIKGIISNLLNPHPYIFWLTIGGPILLAPGKNHWITGGLFLVAFYFCLVGAKIGIAALIAGCQAGFSATIYRRINYILGTILVIFALIFLYNGLQYLRII